jgi:hypothetical protein
MSKRIANSFRMCGPKGLSNTIQIHHVPACTSFDPLITCQKKTGREESRRRFLERGGVVISTKPADDSVALTQGQAMWKGTVDIGSAVQISLSVPSNV